MKTHNKFLLLTLFSLFFLGACSPENDDITDPTPKPDSDIVTISTPNLTAEAKGGIGALTFTTNKSWTANSDQSWCKLDNSYGNASNITINFTLEANPTTEERTAKITINAGTASATATVKQAKKEADKITLNESNFTAEADGETLAIQFTTNQTWTASSDRSWCMSGWKLWGQAGSINLQVTIEANSTTEERTAKITINAGTASATATVKQAKKEIEADNVTLNGSNFIAEAAGKALTISFITNQTWTASSNQTWCTLNTTSGQAGTINLTATIAANPTTEERTAKITITAGTASAKATVKQAKQEPDPETGEGNSIDDMQNQKW